MKNISRFIFVIFLLLFIQVINFTQWIQTSGTPEGAGITDMITTSNGTIVVTCASYNWPSGQQGGIRISNDNGSSWQNVINAYNGRTLHLGKTGKIFASYWPYPSNEGMFYSTNNGLNWTQSFFGGSGDNVFSITSTNNDNNVFIGTRYGVWRSVSNGLWQFVSNGLPANTYVYDLEADSSGTYIAAGTSKGLYITSNNGANWNAVSGISQNDTIYTVKFLRSNSDGLEENYLLIGSSNGKLFESPEGAQYLTAALLTAFLGKVSDIELIDDNQLYFIGLVMTPFSLDNSSGPGFTYSTDLGLTWHEFNSGLPSEPKASRITYSVSGGSINWKLGLFDNTTNGAKIYKMDQPIGIQPVSNEVPEVFSIFQNYPNPFNPMTKIKFNIAKESEVNITVFDVLGRHISTLVNEKLKAGSYQTEWSAVNMPGGVYFYKIETESFTETKKMILVK